MILTLPPLINLNDYINQERRNRYIASSTKKKLTELVAWECRAQKAPKLEKITSLEIIWITKDKRQDKDNLAFGLKFIMDGMVMAGVIPNDTYKLLPNKIIHKFEIGEKPGCVVCFK